MDAEEVVTRNDNGDMVDEHPAFGMVSLSRISSTGMLLAGSSVKHGNYIRLEIKEAQRNHAFGGRTWWYGKKSLIQIYISSTQFSEMIMNANVGDGVPCTINRFNGEGRPDIKSMETPVTEAIRAMEKRLRDVMGKARAMVQKVKTVCAETPGIKKADKEELRTLSIHLENEIGSSLPFAAVCFAETMEETVKDAKGAVEAFVTHQLLSAGMTAMLERGESPVQISHIQDVVVIDVEVEAA
jgi:hypothetical protein